jgi:hypothetical protein
MWPFNKKPTWEVKYAQNIYFGVVAHNEYGNITALTLRIPTALHEAYEKKILLQREMLAFVALMQNANDANLQRVMLAFGDLVVSKAAGRGLQINRDQLAEFALNDVEKLMTDPYSWAQRWLAEFRDDPSDTYMVALFADHCLKLHNAFKGAIEQTRPR